MDLPLTQKTYELYKLFSCYLKDFPKKERYSLGVKTENVILEVLEKVFFINALPKAFKEPELQKINAKVELLKLLIRLSFELKIVYSSQYLILQGNLQEIGKMVGGWLKYVKNL